MKKMTKAFQCGVVALHLGTATGWDLRAVHQSDCYGWMMKIWHDQKVNALSKNRERQKTIEGIILFCSCASTK